MIGGVPGASRPRRTGVAVPILLLVLFLAATVVSARLAAVLADKVDIATSDSSGILGRPQFGAPPDVTRYSCAAVAPAPGSSTDKPASGTSESPAREPIPRRFRDVLARVCPQERPPQRGNLIESWRLSGDDPDYRAELTATFDVPTSSWLVDAVREGWPGERPQAFAEFLLGVSVTQQFTFSGPTLNQVQAGATDSPGSAAPTSAPDGGVAPSATDPEADPPPLPPVTAPAVTTVVLTGVRHASGGEQVYASLGINEVVRKSFALDQRLEVKAGPARIAFVDAAKEDIVQNGQTLSATVKGDPPQTAIGLVLPPPRNAQVLEREHRGGYPNYLNLDSAVFGVTSALDAVAVIWVLVRWRRRTAADGAALGSPDPDAVNWLSRRAAVLIRIAGVAVAVSIMNGILGSLGVWEFSYIPDWFSLSPVGAGVTGAQLAAVLLLAVAVPVVLSGLSRELEGKPASHASSLHRLTIPAITATALVVAVALAALVAVLIDRVVPFDSSRAADLLRDPLRALLVSDVVAMAALLAVLAWWSARTRRRVAGQPRRGRWIVWAGLGVMTVMVLALEATLLTRVEGAAATAVVSIAPAVAAGLALIYAGQLIAAGITAPPVTVGATSGTASIQDGATRWRTGAYLGLAVVAVVIAIPGPRRTAPGTGRRLDWYAGYYNFYSLGQLVTIALIVVLIHMMSTVDRNSRAIGERLSLRATRIMAGCLLTLVWAPTSTWWYAPVAFLVSVVCIRYLLLPRRCLMRAEALLDVNAQQQAQAVAAAVDAVPMRKALDAKISETLSRIATESADQVRSATSELRAKRAELERPAVGVASPDLDVEEICFAHVAGTSSWQRAVTAARDASLVGLPWIVLWIKADVEQVLLAGNEYRLGRFFLAVSFDVVWWAGLGVVFGWAYPVIRGANGLRKAMALLATVALPLLTTTLFPGPPTRHGFVTTAQVVAETASVLMILGLLADYAVLKRAGFGFAKLIELRRLSGVAAWATSLTVAVGAAVTSIVVTGVTGLLTYFSQPDVRPPPDGTSTSQSSTGTGGH